jgi:hypothetical protein
MIRHAEIELAGAADLTHDIEEGALEARFAVYDHAVHVEDDWLELSHSRMRMLRAAD